MKKNSFPVEVTFSCIDNVFMLPEAGVRRYSTKEGVIKNFVKVTSEHLCWILSY